MHYLALILPYATLMTVTVGVIFGIASVWQWRKTRSLTAATELVRAMQTPDFARSMPLVLALPERAAPQLVVQDPELLNAAYVVSHVFESLGVLVFHRLLPLRLVDELIGGYVRASWKRLALHVEAQRVPLGAMFGEWFQWLADRLNENPAPSTTLGA